MTQSPRERALEAALISIMNWTEAREMSPQQIAKWVLEAPPAALRAALPPSPQPDAEMLAALRHVENHLGIGEPLRSEIKAAISRATGK